MKKVFCLLFLILVLGGCGKSVDDTDVVLKDLCYGGNRNNVLYVEEDEALVPYLCFDSGYDGVLLVRKDYRDNDVMFNDFGRGSCYVDSNLDLWLERAMYEKYSDDLQSLIQDTTIDVGVDGTVEQVVRKVFVMSFTELGLSDVNACVEGSKVEGIRDFDLLDEQWLRTSFDSDRAWRYSVETYGPRDVMDELKIRPCFVLDENLKIKACSDRYHTDGYVIVDKNETHE